MENTLRLSKLMAQKGLCSRREADELIQKGQVLVDGIIIATLGTKVDINSNISLSKQAQNFKKNQVTILLNKPVGIVATQPEKGYKEALTLIKEQTQDKKDRKILKPYHLKKLSVAGRLDINSKGLLILTQDGHLAKKLIGENSTIEKEYFVRTKEPITDYHIKKLSSEMVLDGHILKKVSIHSTEKYSFHIILTEGKKRQIRRMCESLNLTVIELKRVRVGHIHLKGLKEGTWRFLKENESFFNA